MDIQWGLGIEHETLIYTRPEKIIGEQIIQNLDYDETHNYFTQTMYNQIHKLLQSDCYYLVLSSIDPNDDILTNPQFFPQLISIFSKYLLNLGSDMTEIQLIEYLSKKENYKIEFDKIIQKLHYDTTYEIDLIEFLNSKWKNRTIEKNITELNLLESFIINYFRLSKPNSIFYYPSYGSYFPIKIDNQFIIDYTGSYHINLSLPYSVKKLREEEEKYISQKDMMKKFWKDKVGELDIKYNKKELFSYFIYSQPILEIKKATLSITPDFMKKTMTHDSTNEFLREYQKVRETYNDKDVWNVFNGNINKNNIFLKIDRKTYHIDIFYLIHGQLHQILSKINSDSRYLIFLDYLKETIDRLPKQYRFVYINFNDNYLVFFLSKRIVLSHNIAKKLRSKETLIKNIREIDIPYFKDDFVITNFNFKHNFLPVVAKYLENTILEKFKLIIFNSVQIVSMYNDRYNHYIKYKESNFHKIHKNYAIGLQFILPMLLSVFSSCDPLSIGDNDKLTELSLRLFISGYSFINLSDILTYGIPEGRQISRWQLIDKKKNNLLDLAFSELSYKDNDLQGTEMRSDPDKGFEFGIELRFFDNFEKKHLKSLLKFLLLLADHIAYLDKSYSENPFNHPILNKQTLMILKQGWNTRIIPDYIHLLESQLNIPINITSSPEYPISYQVMNHIYHYLQENYLSSGLYSKYLIENREVIEDLPNINRQSWEKAFIDYIWIPKNPKTKKRLIIENILKKNKSKKEVERQLLNKLGSDYNKDIDDIYYCLLSIGVI